MSFFRRTPGQGEIMRSVNQTASSAVLTAPASQSLDLPATGFQRQVQVLKLVPFSKSTLWRRVKEGTFPRPLKLSDRVTVWRAEDIRQWINQQGSAP
jgi:prophage regulatory protein